MKALFRQHKILFFQALFVFVVLLALLPLGKHLINRFRPKPPFELSFWYWHTPFKLSKQQETELKKVGIKQLFVRAGTFTSDGKNILLMLPQTYESSTKTFKTHLVFNFDAGIVKHFSDYDLNLISGQITTRVLAQIKRAKQAGLQVQGIQFDFDCPTRLLPRYADLVKRIRSSDPSIAKAGTLQVSCTGLMSWLGSRGVVTLSDQFDFMIPQAYEGITASNIANMRPVSDPRDFQKRIGQADNLHCPFYIGIPAYGHAFLFNETGKLAGIYRGLTPEDALRHPSFKLLSASASDRFGAPATHPQDSTGEEILKFKALLPAPDGRGLGYMLGFTVPTPTLLKNVLEDARQHQSSNCLGAVIYRLSEGDSSMTLPFPTLIDTLSGKNPKPNLKIAVKSSLDNYGLIESEKPSDSAPKDVFLEIENIGRASTFIGPDAIKIELDLDTIGIDEARARDMDAVTFNHRTTDAGLIPSQPRNANQITFTKSFLAPNKKLFIGPIRLLTSHSKTITIKWTIRDSDGFQSYSSKPETFRLASPPK